MGWFFTAAFPVLCNPTSAPEPSLASAAMAVVDTRNAIAKLAWCSWGREFLPLDTSLNVFGSFINNCSWETFAHACQKTIYDGLTFQTTSAAAAAAIQISINSAQCLVSSARQTLLQAALAGKVSIHSSTLLKSFCHGWTRSKPQIAAEAKIFLTIELTEWPDILWGALCSLKNRNQNG